MLSEQKKKESNIEYWSKNLEYMIDRIIQGGCSKEEIPRHCKDFLKSFSDQALDEKVDSIREDIKKHIENNSLVDADYILSLDSLNHDNKTK